MRRAIIRSRQNGSAKAEACSLTQAPLDAGDKADITSQPDLPDNDRAR